MLDMQEFSQSNEKFNMNIAWLIKIDKYKSLFGIALLDDDIEMMFKTLSMLEAETSPKVDNDSVEKNIKWIQDNRNSYIKNDYRGKQVSSDMNKHQAIINKCLETYKLINEKLQKSGILTYTPDDPRKAMGKFQ